MRPAVFFDKDGTLVENVPYNVDPARIRLVTGAEWTLSRLHAARYVIVIASNQSGVARGYFAEDALIGVERRLRSLVGDGIIAAFYWCPHGPASVAAAGCDCRKPLPGLLQRAAADLDIDLRRSWMVGDILDDVEAGNRAGCRSILVDSGGETEWRPGAYREPRLSVARLSDVVAPILEGASRSMPKELSYER